MSKHSFFKTWKEFLNENGTFSENLDKLKNSEKLLLTSPGISRSEFWKYFIGDELFQKLKSEYEENSQNFQEIEAKIGKRILKEINTDLKETITILAISSVAVINKVSKVVRIILHTRTGIEYNNVMIHLAAQLCTAFSEEESYIFLNMLIKCLFPPKFFSEDSGYVNRNLEIKIFNEFNSVICPGFVKMFDLEEKIRNSDKFNASDIKSSKLPFNQFSKKIGDLYLINYFSLSVSNESFLKVVDCTLIFGYDFLLKLTFKILEKKQNDIGLEVKNAMSGLTITKENLTVAGTLAATKHLITFKDKAFKTFLQIAINDRILDKVIEGKKENFKEVAKASSKINFQKIIEGRMEKLQKLQEAFILSKIDMDLNHLEILFNDIESYSLNEHLNQDGKISYLSFIKYMGNPKGKHYWPDHLISTFLTVVDDTSKGYITSLELKVILTLLSADSSEDKLWKICNFFDLNKNFVFELDEAISLIHHLEKILLGEKKISKHAENNMLKKMSNDFGFTESININEFVEMFCKIDELRPLFKLVELTKSLNDNKSSSILMDYLTIKQENFIKNKTYDKNLLNRLLDQKEVTESEKKEDLNNSETFSQYMKIKNDNLGDSEFQGKDMIEISINQEKDFDKNSNAIEERSCFKLF